jgi:exosortase
MVSSLCCPVSQPSLRRPHPWQCNCCNTDQRMRASSFQTILTTEGPAAKRDGGLTPAASGVAQLSLLLFLLGALYNSILTGLARQWWEDPNYSHGFLVPIFCAWVIWTRRDQLRSLPCAPNWSGLLVTVAGLGTLALGVLGAENFLSRVSLLIVLAGLVVQFWGWVCFRALLFPWAALFLMIPLPAIIFNEISLPLQFLASRVGSSLLTLVGVPALREGNVIEMSSLTLDVAEACSGLRFLISLITIAVIYGYFKEPGFGRRIWIVLTAIPVAISANGLRIMGSGIIGEYWSPEKAEGFFHTFSGVVVFAVSLLLLVVLHAALAWVDRFLQSRRTS